MKLPKCVNTCVVFEGILLCIFVTIWYAVNFFHVLKQLGEYFRLMYALFRYWLVTFVHIPLQSKVIFEMNVRAYST